MNYKHKGEKNSPTEGKTLKNSTEKALKITAIVLYALAAMVTVTALITNETSIMVMIPALALAGVIFQSIPHISTNQEIDRMFNHY